MSYSKEHTMMINYITVALNIKNDNYFIISDIFEELEKIKDLSNFKEFIKNEVKNPTYSKYSNGFQKFLKICEVYQPSLKIELDEKESIKVQTYSDKLFSKTTSVFDEIDYQVSIGKDINSTQMTNFIYANFDDKERAVLKQIGDRNRLLFMIRGMREALREQINKIVEDLSLEKKKTVLGLSMTQKTDNEKKMIELINKGKK
jgi:hypothetical protein